MATFTPPVAKPQPAPPQRSAGSAQRTSPAGVAPGRLFQQSIGNQAMLRLLTRRRSVLPREPDPVQTKLKVGAVNDPLERDADRVADEVVRAPTMGASPAAAAPQVSRKCSGWEHEETLRTQRAGPQAASGQASAIVHDELRSPGRPLDAATRAYMEPRFGYDFSGVRVHTGASAARSARSVNSKAFTVGQHVVFGEGRFAPTSTEGQRLLAHELVHVTQQLPPSFRPPSSGNHRMSGTRAITMPTGGGSLPSLMLQRAVDNGAEDHWDKLSTSVRNDAQELYDDCDDLIGYLDEAQLVHDSATRSSWLGFLRRIRSRLEGLDSDSKFSGIKNAYTDFVSKINNYMTKFREEWIAINASYLELRRWMLSKNVRSTDSTEAAKYLEEIYRQTDTHIPFLTTEDDYAPLKNALDKQEYLRIGALRGARTRTRELMQMMRTVADLRRNGEDANNYIPEWSDRVQEEAAYLDSFATLSKEAGREYGVELADLREHLLEKWLETLRVKPNESGLEKAGDFVAGAVGTVTGLFVEAAKEAVDLVQINLHFVTFGHYTPHFISDMAEAAEQGATTSDILTGMVTGMIETPSRFLKACKDGDWKAIGRESVNLYFLADSLKRMPETIKGIPEAVRKLPEFLAKTRESLRILRERTVALGLKNEGRFSPAPPGQTVRQPIPTPPKPVVPFKVETGGSQGSGKPTGMLRDIDSPSRGVDVSADHPVFKNKVPANDPPVSPQSQRAKVAVNATTDFSHPQNIDPAQTASRPTPGTHQPRASTGEPPAFKPPATGTPPSKASKFAAGPGNAKPIVQKARPPVRPAPGSAPLDVALTDSERGLTPEQLRQKHTLEHFDERQSLAHDDVDLDSRDVKAGHETGKSGAGMSAKPKHHVFPQAATLRAWFEARGFKGEWDIDEFTVELEGASHEAIHGGGDYKLGSTTGWDWNSRIMSELYEAEAKLGGGRVLTRGEILAIASRLMKEYRIPQHFVPYK